MNDLAMKREGTFIIDYVILCFFASMAGTIGIIAAADRWMQDPSRYFIWFILAHLYAVFFRWGSGSSSWTYAENWVLEKG